MKVLCTPAALADLREIADWHGAAKDAKPPYESVNLSYFTVPDVNEIKDLRPPKTPKVEKIHILYRDHRGIKYAGQNST
jgi:hypothetical protein